MNEAEFPENLIQGKNPEIKQVCNNETEFEKVYDKNYYFFRMEENEGE